MELFHLVLHQDPTLLIQSQVPSQVIMDMVLTGILGQGQMGHLPRRQNGDLRHMLRQMFLILFLVSVNQFLQWRWVLHLLFRLQRQMRGILGLLVSISRRLLLLHE